MTKQRIRLAFTPIEAVCEIYAKSGDDYCSLTQDYDAEKNEFARNRSEFPTVIMPSVCIGSADGTVNLPVANASLADLKWWVQTNSDIRPVAIDNIAAWRDGYLITQEGLEKGKITILRNLKSFETCKIHFSALYPDPRTKRNITLVSKPMTLATNVLSQDAYKLAIDCEDGILYNPMLDRLLVYDYKLANGLLATGEVRSDHLDSNSYERVIPTHLFRGRNKTADYTLILYSLDSNGNRSSVVDDTAYSIAGKSLLLDLRFVSKTNLDIACIVDGNEVDHKPISINRHIPVPKSRMIGATSLVTKDEIMKYKAIVSYNGVIVEHPLATLDMIWLSSSENASDVFQDTGEIASISIARSKMNMDDIDDYVDVDVVCKVRGVNYIAEVDTDLLVDENDNELII